MPPGKLLVSSFHGPTICCATLCMLSSCDQIPRTRSPEGSVSPQPCPAGTFSGGRGNIDASQCQSCPVGHRCVAGSAHPDSCDPGTFAQEKAQSACSACPAGTFQNEPAADFCKPCDTGAFCARGSARPQSCPEGSYSNRTDLPAEAWCTETEAGFFSPRGSTGQRPCAAGTYAARTGLGSCMPCDMGTYQPIMQQTACLACERGAYCLAGATAAMLCPSGTYGNHTNLTSIEACKPTPPGSYSTAGSKASMPCASGYFSDAIRQAECTRCPLGKYQEDAGATACKMAEPGHWAVPDAMVRCTHDTYNPNWGKSNQLACESCPPKTTTNRLEGQRSADACVCMTEYYDPDDFGEPPGSGRRRNCVICPSGSEVHPLRGAN